MKKVLYVITKGAWGGAQRYVYDLATNLPKEQFDAGVVLGMPGMLAEKLEQAGTTIYRSTALQRDVSWFSDTSAFFALYRLFKKQAPDIVHLNSSKAAGLGALAARISGIKNIVFTVHGWPFLEKRGMLARALIWLASWVTALLAHRVIVISKHDLLLGRRMPLVGRKMTLVYNGIAPQTLGSGEIIRTAFPAGVRITGTIGELHKNKNHIALIELAKQDPALYVAIVGEGEEQPALEQKIKRYGLESRVKLFGFVPAESVLRGFDVFALPSLKEGLPYVLLEAKAAGLPIVANRVGGVGEILDGSPNDFTLERMVQETLKLY